MQHGHSTIIACHNCYHYHEAIMIIGIIIMITLSDLRPEVVERPALHHPQLGHVCLGPRLSPVHLANKQVVMEKDRQIYR